MEWQHLLSSARPHDDKPQVMEPQRSPFQRDFDRIVFSSAFRRLQDKTQVHPLPNTDYVRRRLTHSLEVSCVARSLGTLAGYTVAGRLTKDTAQQIQIKYEIGQITAAAALAHDIGNPPFGHVGESAIGEWFDQNRHQTLVKQLSCCELRDLVKFEGNAQGFRILTRLGNNNVSFKLTAATLGAFSKYPTASDRIDKSYVGSKKHGFFDDDRARFVAAATTLKLLPRSEGTWVRHPLTFLVEAADDICYQIIDVEDGVKVGRIPFKEAEECLVKMLEDQSIYKPIDPLNEAEMGWLRTKAIEGLIQATKARFLDAESEMLRGTVTQPLLDTVPMADAIAHAKSLVVERLFKWDRTVMMEIAGARMLSGLLQDLVEAAAEPERAINKKVLQLINGFPYGGSPYKKLLSITDYVSGMTDSFLLTTHGQVHGYSLA